MESRPSYTRVVTPLCRSHDPLGKGVTLAEWLAGGGFLIPTGERPDEDFLDS